VQVRTGGLVSKRRDRPYRGGRSKHWIKVKNPNDPANRRGRGNSSIWKAELRVARRGLAVLLAGLPKLAAARHGPPAARAQSPPGLDGRRPVL
jgi:hypothetical protein